MTTKKLLTVVVSLAALLFAYGAAQADKPYEGMTPYSPGAAPPNCVAGPTQLCIPLDSTFTTVLFSGQPCSGPANPLDPCRRNDDDFAQAIALPFTFTLYGASHTSVFINNNGNVSFGQGFCHFTSTGFPVVGFPMVAPFWADVDTRGGGGVAHYKIESNRMTVIWERVGYFANHIDKLSTFQLVISDGTDPLVGIGNNVCFCYDDMQWTTGDASGGVNGFGGTPATVGVNKGDGVAFFQLGRFDQPGTVYDGPGGNPDGVDFLDNRRYCFNTTDGNIPPIPQGFPVGFADTVCVLESLVLQTGFISPELGQTTTTVVDLMGLANASVVSTPGNPSTQTLVFTPSAAQANQDFTIRYTAVDDGTPPETTVVNLVVHVCPPPNTPPVCSLAVASEPVLWPPNHKYRAISILGVTDQDAGDVVTITVTGIRQDEPLNTRGDGNTCPDAQIVNGEASVRAERTGTPGIPGNGRVYRIYFTASDGETSCTDSVTVCVPHDQGNGSVCIDDGQKYNSLGPCTGGSRLSSEITEFGLTIGEVTSTRATVEFSLPQDAQVELAVFDVAGRRLATVESGSLVAGVYQRTWDMSGATKGLYFVRLRAGAVTLTKTVVKIH